MPDPLEMTLGAGAAAAVAATLALAGRWWRGRRAAWGSPVLAALALALGLCAGAMLLQLTPRLPPASARDRLLVLLLPAAVLVEALAAAPRLGRWAGWPLRALLAAGVALVVLHGSIYLSPQFTPWSPAQRILWLAGTAAALLLAWVPLRRLALRRATMLPLLALALSSAAAGVTIMLSGSLTTGQAGVVLAGAAGGVALALLRPPTGAPVAAAAGVALVTLLGLLLVGHFFAHLRLEHAILLLLGPSLAWLAEFPATSRTPWRRGALALILVALLPLLVTLDAGRRYLRDQRDNSVSAPADDYFRSGQ